MEYGVKPRASARQISGRFKTKPTSRKSDRGFVKIAEVDEELENGEAPCKTSSLIVSIRFLITQI